MKTAWVVVADEAIARILEHPQRGKDLVPVHEMTDPGAHAKESEMRHGPHGRRAMGAGGANSQATVSAGESERHQHAQVFAARIAQYLSKAWTEKRFAELHVIAAPRLLGYLRSAMDGNVTAAVTSTQDKDVVKESNADLTRRVFGADPARA